MHFTIPLDWKICGMRYAMQMLSVPNETALEWWTSVIDLHTVLIT